MTAPGGVALAGSVALDVEPDASGFYPKLRAQVLPAADAVARDVGRQMSAPVVASMAGAVRDGVRDGGRAAAAQAPRTGEQIGAEMGRAFKARLEAAIKSLPDVEIDANSTKLDKKIVAVKASLKDLAAQDIGDLGAEETDARLQILRSHLSQIARAVEDAKASGGKIPLDVDAIHAGAEVTRLKTEIRDLRAEAEKSIEIQAKVDAAEARAQLAAFNEAKARASEDVKVNVDADTGGAIAALAALVTSETAAKIGMIGLGGAAGIMATAIVPAAASAAAALAAIGPAALVGVAGIGILAFALSGVLGAVKALDQGQAAAGGASASSMISKQNQIASALDGVRNAEQALANAQRQALADQQALTAARESARRSIEDLRNSAVDAALAQRQASLDLIDAQAQLAAVSAPGSGASPQQIARAQLGVDEARQRVTEANVRAGRASTDARTATQKGVEGSPQVTAANDKIRQDQQQIASSTQQLAAAQRSLKEAYASAGDAGAAGANKVADAMAGLSPAGREFARFIVGLKPEFTALRQAAEAGLLPGLEAGMKALLPVMPQITTFVGILARAMGDLFAQAGRALASPFWVNFLTTLGQVAAPLIGNFGVIIGNLAIGFAALLEAFAPLAVQMSGGLANMARSFAQWAQGVSQSEGFKTFLAYVRTNGPIVMDLLGKLAIVAIKLIVGLAPLGAIALRVADAIATFLAKTNPGVLLAIAAAIAIVVAIATGGFIAIAIAAAAVVGAVVYCWTHFQTFRTVVLDVVHAVVTAALWLWNNVLHPTFLAIGFYVQNVLIPVFLFLWRNVWEPMALAIAAIALWLWNSAIHPAFSLIYGFITSTLIPVFLQLWHGIIEPVFRGVAAIITWAWTNVISPLLSGMHFFIVNFLAPIFLFLWHGVVQPAWAGISVVIQIAWAIISVIFGLIQIAIKIVAAIVLWFWREIFEPAFRALGVVLSLVWNTTLKPIFSALGSFIKTDVAPVFKSGVDAISKAWSLLTEAAKTPVRFVVEKVLNEGLLAAYNWIASKFGVDPHDVKVKLPPGFAYGGYVSGPGGPRDDAILARLSAGEYVIPADVVAAWGIDFFNAITGRGRGLAPGSKPGDGSQGIAFPGFADGGLVGFLKSAWKTISDPVGWLGDKVRGIVDGIPGGPWLTSIAKGLGHKVVGGTIDWIRHAITNLVSPDGYAGPISADVKAVQEFIRHQAGKPYVWDAAGPGSYDCSGLVSAVYLLMHGKSAGPHLFSTSDEARYFPLPGHGLFTAGWANPGERGGGSVGHTAGELAGLRFEATPPHVLVGNVNSPVDSFAHTGYYDQGGWLMPGITIARNDTGRPERVLTAGQWQGVRQATDGAARPAPQINVYPRGDATAHEMAGQVMHELAWQWRPS